MHLIAIEIKCTNVDRLICIVKLNRFKKSLTQSGSRVRKGYFSRLVLFACWLYHVLIILRWSPTIVSILSLQTPLDSPFHAPKLQKPLEYKSYQNCWENRWHRYCSTSHCALLDFRQSGHIFHSCPLTVAAVADSLLLHKHSTATAIPGQLLVGDLELLQFHLQLVNGI